MNHRFEIAQLRTLCAVGYLDHVVTYILCIGHMYMVLEDIRPIVLQGFFNLGHLTALAR